MDNLHPFVEDIEPEEESSTKPKEKLTIGQKLQFFFVGLSVLVFIVGFCIVAAPILVDLFAIGLCAMFIMAFCFYLGMVIITGKIF